MTIPNDQEAIKPLPCPFCGSTDLGHFWRGIHEYIECNSCRTRGPQPMPEPGGRLQTALQAWNKRAVQTSYQDLSDCIFDPSFRVLGFSFAVLNELRRQLMLRMCDMEPVTVDGVKKALAIEAWNRRA